MTNCRFGASDFGMTSSNESSVLEHENQNKTEDTGMQGELDYLYSIGFVNLTICIVGLGGNILVFYVVLRFSMMRTVTNIFILALALADIAFLVNIPLLVVTSIIGDWPFGNLYCKVYYSVSTINQFASSFFLVTMSADRYLAICWPILSRRLRTTGAAMMICYVVWSLAIGLMYPVFAYSGTETHVISDEGDTITQCNIFWPGYNSSSLALDGTRSFALYCFALGYAVPVCLMLFFYGMVLRHIRGNHEKIASKTSDQTSASYDRRRTRIRRVTMMIFIVILVYIMSWTPYWGLQLHLVFSGEDDQGTSSQVIIYTCLTLQCLCFANSAINPILYAVLSDNFKQSYAKAFRRTKKEPPPSATKCSKTALLKPRSPSVVPEITTSCTFQISHIKSSPPGKTWLPGDALYQVGAGILVAL